MKKFILLLNLLCLASFVYGQGDPTPDIRRHTITFSYAEGGYHDWGNFFSNNNEPILEYGEYGFKMVGYNKRTYSGVFGLSYSYKPIPRLEVGTALHYEQSWELWKIYNDPNGPHDRIQRDHYLSPTVNASFLYVAKESIDLYSGIDLGAQWIWNNVHDINSIINPREEFNYIYQVWCINLRIKYKALAISGGLGFGYLGVFRLGVGIQL